jgi:K+-transporting ATPase KdpF subunit
MGVGAGMTATQAVLLALSIVLFVYLGVAMFKPEWF